MNIKEVIDEIAVISTLIKNTNDPNKKNILTIELNNLLILYAKLSLNLK